MRSLVLLVGTTSLCLAMGLTMAATANAEKMHWKVAGFPREATVISPSKPDPSGKSPVVLAFHGHGGDIEDVQEGMHFDKTWPEAIVVYLQGLPTDAKDPTSYGWVYDKARDGQRDVLFVDAVLATVRANFKVDDRRVYAVGFSNGGMFTYVLWATRPNVFAAFASVAGRMIPAANVAVPKPFIQIAGIEDERAPLKDQLRSLEKEKQINGTDAKGSVCGQDCLFYASKSGTPIVTWFHPGGHFYPEVASTLIVEFLKDYKLPE